jgi:NADP oxidoreductase coenzyme F420-dependent
VIAHFGDIGPTRNTRVVGGYALHCRAANCRLIRLSKAFNAQFLIIYSQQMRIGIIGAGSMGGILARQLTKLANDVPIANSIPLPKVRMVRHNFRRAAF